MRSILFVVLLMAGSAFAQSASDPNLANPTRIVTAKIKDYTIAGMVTHLEGAKSFAHGIALFPGHPGIMKIREEAGEIRYGQVGNFLVRSRRHWLDEETLVVVVDAPSDQWIHFDQAFRATPRYAADVAALIGEVGQRFPV